MGNEALGIQCSHIGVVPELLRGIRMHFPKLVKGFTAVSSDKSQLGLSHSYSRAKVKFNVNKSDNMIIQSIALLDQLDKDINTFCMRIREWYSYHFPELIKIVPENALYAKCLKLIKNRKELAQDKFDDLETILMDSGRAQAVIDASKSSMGMDISPVDLLNIDMFASRVIGITDYRKELSAYLRSKMSLVAPNLSALIGEQVGARLISHAGSLTNLAKYPASTVQILGAEKALFRALKTKGNTPKYGLIFHSSFIGLAGAKNKGRISRYLANKCTIASRIDCFAESTCDVYGTKLREQVEDRLKFYESGDIPRKNVDVMQEAITEANAVLASMNFTNEKKKKKKKNGLEVSMVESENGTNGNETEADKTMDEGTPVTNRVEKKKKKKKNKAGLEVSVVESENGADKTMDESVSEEPEKKKKKKKKNADGNDKSVVEAVAEPVVEAAAEPAEGGSKKSKKRSPADSTLDQSAVEDAEATPSKKSKKKKKNAD